MFQFETFRQRGPSIHCFMVSRGRCGLACPSLPLLGARPDTGVGDRRRNESARADSACVFVWQKHSPSSKTRRAQHRFPTSLLARAAPSSFGLFNPLADTRLSLQIAEGSRRVCKRRAIQRFNPLSLTSLCRFTLTTRNKWMTCVGLLTPSRHPCVDLPSICQELPPRRRAAEDGQFFETRGVANDEGEGGWMVVRPATIPLSYRHHLMSGR